MMVRGVAIELDGMPRRDFRRFVWISALLHLGGALLFLAAPLMPDATLLPGVITVNLVAAPSTPRAAPVAPQPRPKPKPPMPAPVILPEKPIADPEPRAVAPKPLPLEPEAPVERDYTDVLADLRAELGEEEPDEPAEPVQTAALGAGGSGPPRPVSPEVAAWLRKARIHVRRSWVVPPGFRSQSLQAVIAVELDATGVVVGEPRVERRSGNPWYDDGVVRSIRKASPLPAPPQAGAWTFVMLSDDDY